jgi:hypothetical protein
LHKEIHRGPSGGPYNRDFANMWKNAKGRRTVDDVVGIRDALAKKYGLEKYRPW